jgi:hypothetical protein
MPLMLVQLSCMLLQWQRKAVLALLPSVSEQDAV